MTSTSTEEVESEAVSKKDEESSESASKEASPVQQAECDHGCFLDTSDNMPVCECHPGYVQEANNTCTDINECLEDNGGCDHICTNRYRTVHVKSICLLSSWLPKIDTK